MVSPGLTTSQFIGIDTIAPVWSVRNKHPRWLYNDDISQCFYLTNVIEPGMQSIDFYVNKDVKDCLMETAAKIIEKAYLLFMNYGIRSVSMDEIAHQLGMSKKTIYKFFKDKEAIIETVIEIETCKNLSKMVVRDTTDMGVVKVMMNNLNHISGLFRKISPAILFGLKKYYPNAYNKIIIYTHQVIYPLVKDNIDKGIKEGLYRNDFNPEVLVGFLFKNFMSLFCADAMPFDTGKQYDIEANLIKHFLFGITTCEGHQKVRESLEDFGWQ